MVADRMKQQGATLYTIQLGLNLIWMPLFFGWKRPIEASVDIVGLTGVVGYLAYVWGQVDEQAGWLLAPYLAWLGFANYLCIGQYNRVQEVAETLTHLGAGYLNGWDFSGKEKSQAGKPKDTTFVDEKP